MAIDFGALVKRAGKAAAENSPAILTALAVTGTIGTAVLAAAGGIRAAKLIAETEEHETVTPAGGGDPVGIQWAQLDLKDKFKLTWKCYIPAAASAALTVAAIVSVNRIGERKIAAMATAYKVTEKYFKDYREKTVEKVGKNKEQTIREEVAQVQVDENPPESTQLIYTGKGTTMVYDLWNKRYFDHDIEAIRQAVNTFNQKVIHENFASLNDFWDILDVEQTYGSEVVGWNTDKLMEIDYQYVTRNGQPILELSFINWPTPRYDDLH